MKEATKRVELIEKAIDDLYAVSRDDEVRSQEKDVPLSEDFLGDANFHDDAFETVRNHRRALYVVLCHPYMTARKDWNSESKKKDRNCVRGRGSQQHICSYWEK